MNEIKTSTHTLYLNDNGECVARIRHATNYFEFFDYPYLEIRRDCLYRDGGAFNILDRAKPAYKNAIANAIKKNPFSCIIERIF